MNDYDWIWQTILIFYGGRILLRLAGRKSISQMTITQVVVMIGIGSLLIQPIAQQDIFHTLAVGLLITLLMIITEYIEMKVDILETISTGKARIIIENGELNLINLRKLRMSADRLETRLRQSGISSIEDIQCATIEVSGQLGYELKENKKPMTKDDFNTLMSEIAQIKMQIGIQSISEPIVKQQSNLFSELYSKQTDGNKEP